jgi:hypothetical protein
LVYSIYDSTEEAIKKKLIESCESIIDEQHNSSAVNNHSKLKIKTLENAPIRDPDKLQRLLQSKEKEVRSYAHGGHTETSYRD